MLIDKEWSRSVLCKSCTPMLQQHKNSNMWSYRSTAGGVESHRRATSTAVGLRWVWNGVEHIVPSYNQDRSHKIVYFLSKVAGVSLARPKANQRGPRQFIISIGKKSFANPGSHPILVDICLKVVLCYIKKSEGTFASDNWEIWIWLHWVQALMDCFM
jgi:hypothetical protein